MSVINWPDGGELTRLVKIRRWTSEPNYDMGLTEQFNEGVGRWAKIEPVSGAAYWGSQQVADGVTHRIWIRYGTGSKDTDITQQHVVDWPLTNQRFRVQRSVNVGDAQCFTMLEVKLLGPIT